MLLRRASSEPTACQRRSLFSFGIRNRNTSRRSVTEPSASLDVQPASGMVRENSVTGNSAAASRPLTAPHRSVDTIRRHSRSRSSTPETRLRHSAAEVAVERPAVPQGEAQEITTEVTSVPPPPRACCGVVVDTPCLPIPTPPPLPEAPAVQEEALLPTGKVAAKNVPQTVPGTCLVCLSESEETVGAGWVHQESETDGVIDKKAVGCGISACLPCLKTYFEGIVTSGFDGACPRMRCMCCTRVVCEQAWAALVEPEVVDTFRRRAATLLSLQCGNCHSRGTMMVTPPADHSYSSALDTLTSNVASSLDCHLKDDDKRTRDSITEAFRTAMVGYVYGEDADVAKFYDHEVEPVIALGEEEERYKRMVDVLRCVEDSERRAGIHIRYLRFHPMIKTACCDSLHCFRCRVLGGHPNLTCEQYEASRGHEDVMPCPGCGVYVVKGDGCNSITCVCGKNFDWSELIHQRNLQSSAVFRVAYPEDTARAAIGIVRRGGPTAGDRGGGNAVVGVENAVDGDEDDLEQDTSDDDSEAEEEQEQEGAAPAPVVQELIQESIQEPIQEPVPTPPLLVPGSEEEFRMANLFVEAFPTEISRARAAMYSDDNPHFTAEIATFQVGQLIEFEATGWSPPSYFGERQPRQSPSTTNSSSSNASELRQWYRTAARDWLQNNTTAVREMTRRGGDARLALVDAFYGGRNSHATIAGIAAEHARAGLRLVRAAGGQGGLFSWLGLAEPVDEEEDDHDDDHVFPSTNLPVTEEAAQSDNDAAAAAAAAVAEATWDAPFAAARIEEEPPIPSPSVLWGPRAPREFTPPRPSATVEPPTRLVSATEAFGSHRTGPGVAEWMVSRDVRQARLRCLMALEEGRLSEAWVALWGRRGGSLGEGEAVQAAAVAARRVAFLEAYPEHACREQGAMMKAFVRRNYAAVERARRDAIEQRAAAWERMHSSRRRSGGGTASGGRAIGCGKHESPGGGDDSCAFEDALAAYNAHVARRAATAAASGQRRSSSAAREDGSSSSSSSSLGDKQREAALHGLLASAWEVHNRPRVIARRFRDAHSEEAATVAVVALTVMPMLIGRASFGCDCGVDGVVREAAEWARLNAAEFERALESKEACMRRGAGRALPGVCECKESGACGSLVACPAAARRMLKLAECHCLDDDPLGDGFALVNLFS